jgi:hypothetical protein
MGNALPAIIYGAIGPDRDTETQEPEQALLKRIETSQWMTNAGPLRSNG